MKILTAGPHTIYLTKWYLLLLTSCLLLLPLYLMSEENSRSTQLKGVFIHKIASYLKWKSNPNNKIAYCFLGKNSQPVAAFLITQQSLGKLPDKINISNLATLTKDSVEHCDLLYVDKNTQLDQQQLAAIPSNVFTISNDKQWLEYGFIATIELDENKPQLTLSKSNLKSATITIDTRFLSIATVVK